MINYKYCGFVVVRKGAKVENHNLKEYAHLFKSVADGNPIWKIGIYVRLSKDDGNSISLSIINQIKIIARYIRNFKDFTIIEIYIDDGITGTDFDRNDYIRLQEDIQNKFVNCIIVKDLTRYARNIADGIKELDNFVLEKKIRFVSVGIPEIDTFKDPTQISSSEVYQALQSAEDFARITSKKVRDIKEIKREDGEKNGGFPPYGYLPNPDGEHWLYDPVAGKIIKKMYLWSAEGLSDREIAKKLNALNIPNPTAYKKSLGLKFNCPNSKSNSGLWWPTTVSRILSDKTNIGCSVQGKSSSFDHKRHKQIPKKKEDYVIVEDCHEKAISEELFEKVAKMRTERTRISKADGKIHMFASLVYCKHCKRAMKKTSAKGKNYLVCRTYRDIGKEYCSYGTSINFEVLENISLKVIQSQINLVIDLQAIVEKINCQPIINNQSIRLNQMIENVKKEIAKAEHIIDGSYYDWKNDEISKEQYQRIRSEMEKNLDKFRNTFQILVTEQRRYQKGIQSNNDYFEHFLKYKNIETLDRLILLELIHKIYVYKDKSIKVEFNFNNQYILILDYIKFIK